MKNKPPKSPIIDGQPKLPREPAMRELYYRFQAEFHKSVAWLVDNAIPSVLSATLEKASSPLPRPLTKEEIQNILQAIHDRFAFVAAQMQSEFTPPKDVLERWKAMGLVGQDVTAESFTLAATEPEMHLIRNAFIFGRLHAAMEQGKNYADILKLATGMPLQKPDLHAIAVAEQQSATYITAMGDHLGTEAGRVMAEKNRAIIQRMAIDYHKKDLTAKVLDEEAKREAGFEIPEVRVDNWRQFSSELYHTMEDKARDWDRVAYTELYDARNQGQAMDLLEKFGPEQLVYKMPLPTACPQCKHAYLEADGVTPRVFKLANLISNGTNIGRKPHPVRGGTVLSGGRSDGKTTLRPVAGLMHPWCACLGPYLFTGKEVWAQKERMDKSKAIPGAYLIKAHVKAHERMSASGQKLEPPKEETETRAKEQTAECRGKRRGYP